MASGGVFPSEEPRPPKRVDFITLAEFDALMEEGGIDAVIDALALKNADPR